MDKIPIPYIGNEEEKMEREPLKLLGTLQGDQVADAPFRVSAQCNRVPVRDGHTECVSVEFGVKPTPEQAVAVLGGFTPPSEVAGLPSTPPMTIVVRRDPDRPQPIRDRDVGEGMSIAVGRVRPCPLFDLKFVVLGHNTIRGAAGGAIHNAELLLAQGWIA